MALVLSLTEKQRLALEQLLINQIAVNPGPETIAIHDKLVKARKNEQIAATLDGITSSVLTPATVD